MKCVFESTRFTGGEVRQCLERQAGMLYKVCAESAPAPPVW